MGLLDFLRPSKVVGQEVPVYGQSVPKSLREAENWLGRWQNMLEQRLALPVDAPSRGEKIANARANVRKWEAFVAGLKETA